MPTSSNEKKLGKEMPITRRDFIGSTLVGAGSTLMATRSPGLSAADRPQFSGLLGSEWTGPGGIGDYAASNGNTAEVVNAAHAIRTGQFIDAADEANDTGETFDLVVVGGGFSGLSAAYTFRKHAGGNGNCLILDNHPIFGGEAKQNEFEVDGYHLYGPQGSNGNLWPVSVTRQMGFYHEYWSELGLPDEFVWQELYRASNPARFRGGCTVVAVENVGSDENGRVNVTYYKNGSLHKLTAKSVVMAANQAVNKKIVKGLTPELHDAMDSFMHGPVLTVNVAVRNWKFMEKLGITAARWFEGFGWFTCIRRQLMIDGQEPMPLDPNKPTVLTMYVPFLYPGMPVKEQAIAARYSLLGPGFSNFELQIREQLQTLFGASGFDAKRDIAGIVLNRWGHAYVVQPPGFYFGKNGKPAAKDVIRNTIHGRIAFAHSELAGAQVWQTAAAEGKRAIEQLL